MRIPLLAFAALSLVPLQVACDFEDFASSDRFREDFQFTYALKPGGRLAVDNFNGSIEILGWEKDSVQITGTKYASRRDSLDDLRIEIDHASPDAVSIRTVRPTMHGNMGARYTIRVPRQVQLDRITSSNGQIRVEDIQGALRLETSNGAIRLRTIEGRLEARTSNGAIEGDGMTGDVTLRTSNGGIRLDRVAGALDATTSNGGIHIRLGKPKPNEPVKVHSSNGSIELELEALDNNEIRASTSNSSITLRLPAAIKAHLRASTSNSSITSDFDVTMHGTMNKNHLEGDINGGGPLIDASSSNGTIRILKF
jgi:DUF4097 and DUF4098 domain-containing protein YvlB